MYIFIRNRISLNLNLKFLKQRPMEVIIRHRKEVVSLKLYNAQDSSNNFYTVNYKEFWLKQNNLYLNCEAF